MVFTRQSGVVCVCQYMIHCTPNGVPCADKSLEKDPSIYNCDLGIYGFPVHVEPPPKRCKEAQTGVVRPSHDDAPTPGTPLITIAARQRSFSALCLFFLHIVLGLEGHVDDVRCVVIR